MNLHREHRTYRNGLLHQTRYDFVSRNTQSESKTKPNGCKTQSDFAKRKIVPEIYMYKKKFACKYVKLSMLNVFEKIYINI